MKFWRNAAALLTVFHPETTHTGNHSTPRDVKNEGRPGYVYENKWTSDRMSETISGICARLKPFLQEIGLSSSPNSSKVPRTYRTAVSAKSLVLTEYLGMVLDSANSLLGIITDILDFSKFEGA
jgi:hypothetical protein